MQMKLDFRSGVPIYIQIMDQIKQAVVAGELNPGDQLPTVRQLATDLRVNFNTVARAYRLLDEAGFISTQHGRGTYILEPDSAEAKDRLKAQSLEELALHYLREAERLGCSLEEVTTAFQQALEAWKNEHPDQPGK